MNTPSLCDTLPGLQFGQLGHCVGHVRQDRPLSFAAFGICFASTLGIVPAVDLNTTINKIEKIIKWNYFSNDTQILLEHASMCMKLTYLFLSLTHFHPFHDFYGH